MNTIQDWGINNLLTRRLNITDSPGPASTLAPEVMPVLQVKAPEEADRYLIGEKRCGNWAVVSGGVGSFGVYRIYNPTGSGTIVTVDWLSLRFFTSAASAYCAIGLGGALTTTPTYPGSVALDTRYRATGAGLQSVAQTVWDVVAAAPFTQVLYRLYDEVTRVPTRIDAVLAPGYAFDVWPVATNQSIAVNLSWRERAAQPSELV